MDQPSERGARVAERGTPDACPGWGSLHFVRTLLDTLNVPSVPLPEVFGPMAIGTKHFALLNFSKDASTRSVLKHASDSTARTFIVQMMEVQGSGRSRESTPGTRKSSFNRVEPLSFPSEVTTAQFS